MCVRSGLEPTAAYMSEPTSSVYSSLLRRVGTSSVFVRFSFVDNGVCVGFAEFIPKRASTLRMYGPCDRCIVLLPLFLCTSRPTIRLIGPRSLHGNLELISCLAASITCLFGARIAISSTCTARIVKSCPVVRMYAQWSTLSHWYPLVVRKSLSAVFHARPACLSPYSDLTTLCTLLLPSWRPGIGSMYKTSSSGSVALRYVPTTSIWSNSQSNCAASAISTRSVSIRTTGENVSVYSVPKCCVKPHATSRALRFKTLPFLSHFVWKTMRHPIVLRPGGKCSSLNVPES